jgi:hypothetical protein
VDAGPDTVMCPGQILTLYSPKQYPFTQWLPGGIANLSLDVTKPGEYKLLVTDRNGCIASDSLHVNELPLVTINAGSDTTLNAGDILQLEKAWTKEADSYRWSTEGTGSFGNEYNLSTWYSPSYNDISNGSVTLTLEATNRCATVKDDLVLTIKQDDDGITAYPNPTRDEVTLVCTKGVTIQTASITTHAGVVILPNVNVNGSVMKYNLSNYPPGTFLFHLITPKGIVTKSIDKH